MEPRALRAVLARIERLKPTINAYCTPTPELARTTARAAEATVMRGDALGPPHAAREGDTMRALVGGADVLGRWLALLGKTLVCTADRFKFLLDVRKAHGLFGEGVPHCARATRCRRFVEALAPVRTALAPRRRLYRRRVLA